MRQLNGPRAPARTDNGRPLSKSLERPSSLGLLLVLSPLFQLGLSSFTFTFTFSSPVVKDSQ